MIVLGIGLLETPVVHIDNINKTMSCASCGKKESGWEHEYEKCALSKIQKFMTSRDSDLFTMGSKYFDASSSSRQRLYIFITYTRCDDTHGFIDVPIDPSVRRLDMIQNILSLLIHRSAERSVPVTQIRLYAAQPAQTGVQVGNTRYRMHKTYTIDLITRSLKTKLLNAGAKIVNGDPGFLHLQPELTYAELVGCATEGCRNHRLPSDTLCYKHFQTRCSDCKVASSDDLGSCNRLCHEEYTSFSDVDVYNTTA
jgi:hypothetical protein